MQGTVKWFNALKGFGFITGEDGQEYFVHYSQIMKQGFKTVKENKKVQFDAVNGEKGLQALNVVEL